MCHQPLVSATHAGCQGREHGIYHTQRSYPTVSAVQHFFAQYGPAHQMLLMANMGFISLLWLLPLQTSALRVCRLVGSGHTRLVKTMSSTASVLQQGSWSISCRQAT